jgi:hypothetical protein
MYVGRDKPMLSVRGFLCIRYIQTLLYLVYVDDAEGEADVDDDEDEKEDEDVNDHVGHADDDGSSLPPHQPSLITNCNLRIILKKKNLDINAIGELCTRHSVKFYPFPRGLFCCYTIRRGYMMGYRRR